MPEFETNCDQIKKQNKNMPVGLQLRRVEQVSPTHHGYYWRWWLHGITWHWHCDCLTHSIEDNRLDKVKRGALLSRDVTARLVFLAGLV